MRNILKKIGLKFLLPLDEAFFFTKGWLAIAKLKPLSRFISLLLMLKKALDNGKMVK